MQCKTGISRTTTFSHSGANVSHSQSLDFARAYVQNIFNVLAENIVARAIDGVQIDGAARKLDVLASTSDVLAKNNPGTF